MFVWRIIRPNMNNDVVVYMAHHSSQYELLCCCLYGASFVPIWISWDFFLDLRLSETLNLLFLHQEKIRSLTFLLLESVASLKPAITESPVYLFSILLIVWVVQLLMYLTVMRFSYPRWCQCMLVGKKQFYSFLQFQFRALFFRRCFLQCFLVLNWPFFIPVATFFPCSITFNGYIIYAEINDVILYWKYMFLCNTIISFWWEGRS